MNKVVFTVTLLLSFSMSVKSLGSGTGFDVGNGGIGISRTGTSRIELLDLFEMRYTDQVLDPSFLGLSELQLQEEVLKRLEKICPIKTPWSAIFPEFIKGLYLVYPQSGDQLIFPRTFLSNLEFSDWQSLNFHQLAVQYEKPDQLGFKTFINGHLFSQLHRIDKVALLTHELIFSEYRKIKKIGLPNQIEFSVRGTVRTLFSASYATDDKKYFRSFCN